MDKNTTRHSERSEESSITRYKTGNVIANVAWQSRHYVINSFRKLAYGKGLIWILRFAQNDGWVKTLDYIITGLSRKVNLARNDGYARKLGFTMAEILLSLTIIGVVAAITLPSLTGNINERTWDTQRKALYARMSQAISLMDSLNSYGQFVDPTEENEGIDTVAISFVRNGLAKVLKINNICDNENIKDCGIPNKITHNGIAQNGIQSINIVYTSDILTMDKLTPNYVSSTAKKYPATKAVAFETQNGEHMLAYVNPKCRFSLEQTNKSVCANFIYDLNGTKGPNTIGKDIGFITAIYPSDSFVVAPLPTVYIANGTRITAVKTCKNYGDDIKLPTIYEYMSIWSNGVFGTIPMTGFWSNSPANENGTYLSFGSRYGILSNMTEDTTSSYVCIRRAQN